MSESNRERVRSFSGRLRAWAEKDGRGYPDWAVRYLPVARRLGWGGRPLGRVLEIGANENGFARFTGARVIAADIERAQLTAARAAQSIAPVQADIGALPFADGAFDTVICLDTYEHLPAGRRAVASREILRVLRPTGRAVIGFPCGAAAEAAEGRIRGAYRALTAGNIRWLEEHVAMGLPDADGVYADVVDAAAGRYRVTRHGNGSVFLWRWMWLVLLCGWPGRGNAVFQVLLRILVPVISRVHVGACYRTLIWVAPVEAAR